MKHVHLTWYLLVDGTHADPDDVSPGEDGVLRHKSGMAVALHENGVPQSIGVDAVNNKNVEAASAGVEAAAAAEAQRSTEAQSEQPASEAVVTEIDPATGLPAATPTAEVVPEVRDAVAEKPKKLGRDRQMKPGAAKTYKTR